MLIGIQAVEPHTLTTRVAVVALGAVFLLLSLGVVRRIFSASYFRGFLAAVGLFLSFDIIVFHWIFRLHRITEGPEANVIEPILVAAGIWFVVYSVVRERHLTSRQWTSPAERDGRQSKRTVATGRRR